MMTPFARLATTLTLSLGIALSPISAAPAKADERTDALVATILGLAVVGAIIDDNRRDARRDRRLDRDIRRDDRRDDWRDDRRGDRRRDGVHRSKILPGQCLRYFRTVRGGRDYMGGACLQRNYDHANRLPHRCSMSIMTYNRRGDLVRRTVYRQGCLSRAGYVIAGR